jgi:hypothetical protein
LRFIVKLAYGTTSQVHINVNKLGRVPIVHMDRTPIVAYELTSGQLLEIAYDGSEFQLMSGGAVGQTVVMQASRDFYVNGTIGDDTLYDGTSATISGTMTGPFKTIQKALAVMTTYNLGGWAFRIHVADGSYTTAGRMVLPTPNGSGYVYILGNSPNPSACQIFNTYQGCAVLGNNGGNYYFDGISFRATAPMPGDGGHGLWIMSATNCTLGACDWNAAAPGSQSAHIVSGPSAFVFITGLQRIFGSAGCHHWGYANGVVYNTTPGDPALTIMNPVSFPAGFSIATNGGQTRESWGTITGAANVTGPRYTASLNGVIDSTGRGASYLPGTTPGVLVTGGQYQ